MILHTGDFKLDLTPGRRPPHRPGPHGRHRPERGHPPAPVATPPTPTSTATPRRRPSVGKVLYNLFHAARGPAHRSPPASPATSTASSRSPTPPSLRPHQVATLGMSMKKNVRLAREMGLLHIPENGLLDIDDIGDLRPGEVCVISTGSQGEPMSALALHGRRREPLAHARRGRHGHPQLAPDPRQRDQRDQGHRRAHPARASRSCTPASRTCTPPATPSRRSSRPSSRSREPEWFIPVHGEYRHLVAHAELARQMGCRPTTCWCARTATSSCSTTTASRGSTSGAGRLPLRRRHRRRRRPRRAPRPPGAGRGGRRRRRRHRRHRRPAPSSPAPRSSPAAGSTRPRPRTCSTSAADAVRRSIQRRGRRRTRPSTSRRSSATCAGRRASSSTTAPSADP